MSAVWHAGKPVEILVFHCGRRKRCRERCDCKCSCSAHQHKSCRAQHCSWAASDPQTLLGSPEYCITPVKGYEKGRRGILSLAESCCELKMEFPHQVLVSSQEETDSAGLLHRVTSGAGFATGSFPYLTPSKHQL